MKIGHNRTVMHDDSWFRLTCYFPIYIYYFCQGDRGGGGVSKNAYVLHNYLRKITWNLKNMHVVYITLTWKKKFVILQKRRDVRSPGKTRSPAIQQRISVCLNQRRLTIDFRNGHCFRALFFFYPTRAASYTLIYFI